MRLFLCDDDGVEKPNVETGALLQVRDINSRKARIACTWVEKRGFQGKIVERFIDAKYRRCASEPLIALSGFDNNEARHFLAAAGYTRLFDAGLGSEAGNFDAIALRSWPHVLSADAIWPIESEQDRQERKARQRAMANSNAHYQKLAADECGRLLVAGKIYRRPLRRCSRRLVRDRRTAASVKQRADVLRPSASHVLGGGDAIVRSSARTASRTDARSEVWTIGVKRF